MTSKNTQDVKVVGFGGYVPTRFISNDDLARKIDTSDEWIVSHTGIKGRYIAREDELVSDMAAAAIADFFSAHPHINPLSIGGILLATGTSDYHGLPSAASIAASKAGLAPHIFACDLAAACSGFIYALEIGRQLVRGGAYDNLLVVGADKMSSVLDWEDRSTCVLFGDGAACALLSSSHEGGRVVDGLLASDTRGWNELGVYPRSSGRAVLTMNGKKVYDFAVAALRSTVLELMERNGLTADAVRWIVPHQANVRIIAAASDRLKMDRAKFFTNKRPYANTSAASVPLALHEMSRDGLLSRGDIVLTVGFGAGLSYGGNVLQW